VTEATRRQGRNAILFLHLGLFFATVIVSVKAASQRIQVKLYSVLTVLFLCACTCLAQSIAAKKRAAAAFDKAEKDDVAYVKAIDVKTLDPSLLSQRLGDWLKSGPPQIDFLKWMPDETCDEKPDLDSDCRRCVRIEFRRGGQSGYFLVLIGTLKKGIIGPPRLYFGPGGWHLWSATHRARDARWMGHGFISRGSETPAAD
jgi:hypothetical protein